MGGRVGENAELRSSGRMHGCRELSIWRRWHFEMERRNLKKIHCFSLVGETVIRCTHRLHAEKGEEVPTENFADLVLCCFELCMVF